MANVVFKQSYKPMNRSKTPMLNRKHLQYIATRPGTVYNQDCGFGLFGKLPFVAGGIQDIQNLKQAEEMVGLVSKRRTMYRALVSIDHETALEKGYYDREKWEDLLKARVLSIAKEMDIKDRDFCFMASMHYKKGHPHVHLLYWDNGSSIRQEHIPTEAFVIKAEHIRAAFGKEVFREELKHQQDEKAQTAQALRLDLLATLKELNPTDILDVNKIHGQHLEAISQEFEILLRTLATTKDRRYAYLKPDIKSEVDGFLAKVLQLPGFKGMGQKYLTATREIAALYGNEQSTIAHNLEKAQANLYREMGNQLLSFVKDTDIVAYLGIDVAEEKRLLLAAIQGLHFGQDNALYQRLKQSFPTQRTPLKAFMTDEDKTLLHRLTMQVLHSPQIRRQLDSSVNFSMLHAVKTLEQLEETEGFTMSAEKLADLSKETANIRSDSYRAARWVVLQSIYADMGYRQNYLCTMAISMLKRMFGDTSQSKNFLQSQLKQQRGSSHLSKAAKKDLKAKRQHGDMER